MSSTDSTKEPSAEPQAPKAPEFHVGPQTTETPAEAAPAESAAAEDVVSSEDESAAPEADNSNRIAELEAQAQSEAKRADENWDKLVRLQAEMDNQRKRAARDVDNARKFGLEKFATELLAVRDSLEMGLDAASQEGADVAKIREGTDLTLKMLTQAMGKFDIEEVNPMGEAFNPELHQAMSMQPAAEGQAPNSVTMVMQKGYTLNGRLIRPAMVMIAK